MQEKVKKIVIQSSITNPYKTSNQYNQETLFNKISNQFKEAASQKKLTKYTRQISNADKKDIQSQSACHSVISSRSNKFKIANLLHNFQQYQNQYGIT